MPRWTISCFLAFGIATSWGAFEASRAAGSAPGAAGAGQSISTETMIRVRMAPGDQLWQARQALWRGGSGRAAAGRFTSNDPKPRPALGEPEATKPIGPEKHAQRD